MFSRFRLRSYIAQSLVFDESAGVVVAWLGLGLGLGLGMSTAHVPSHRDRLGNVGN